MANVEKQSARTGEPHTDTDIHNSERLELANLLLLPVPDATGGLVG